MARSNSSKSLRGKDFQVCPEHRPGWIRGSERALVEGEAVYCAAGEGVVLSLHGRTSDGSRLLQIRLVDEAPPFFAAASNVMVKPN